MPFVKLRRSFQNPIKILWLLVALLVQCLPITAQPSERTYIHQISVDYRPNWMIPTDPLYIMESGSELSFGPARSGHLQYAFALPEGSTGSEFYPRTYQGIGLSIYDFGNSRELGTPVATYLFQRSEIISLGSRLSLDYEWNFGLSTGWRPYHPEINPNNVMVGSKFNAYINVGTFVNWQVSRQVAVKGGVDFTHFSNGNTSYPNVGVNLSGIKVGMAYTVSKITSNFEEMAVMKKQPFSRHLSYDVILFGSWRRKGVDFLDKQVASPHRYPVVGAYIAPMYNWAPRLRTGFSLDALHDGSANVYTEDYIVGTEQKFYKPKWPRQLALGMSFRADYMMPLFTIGAGIGTHLLHPGGDFSGTYQAFALKLRVAKSSFLHVGYNIKDFNEPNYLMLGVGYRFNNKMPPLLSQ